MVHSFLLIGQSNMAGRGFPAEALPIDTEHIKVLRNGRWQSMYRPVNGDRSFSGVSLAESFAEAYAKVHGVDVGLIPCADGGTSLAQWRVGGLLFDHAIAIARLAQRTSTIAGVLWHQGESDCGRGRHTTYAERFQPIMDAFRRELDLYDVPFLLGGLGDFLPLHDPDWYKTYPTVNEQLKALADKNPMTGYVPADGLSANPDNLHFSAAALHAFGLRYYEVFETLRDKNKVFEEKPCPDDALRSELEKL
ncbi:MAG: sialate O-acetylesterase [Clostridia bacterium]|nr:sialate O-acetylesterase [Clostridia bacterium]